MAGIPLNTFKTRVHVVLPDPVVAPLFIPGPTGTGLSYPTPTDSRYRVYQAPLGTTGVVLYAQVANVGAVPYTVTFWHYRPPGQSFSPPFPYTELVQEITVPPNDSLVLLAGKLVLETSDAIFIKGSAPIISGTDPKYITDLKLTVSILESANQ